MSFRRFFHAVRQVRGRMRASDSTVEYDRGVVKAAGTLLGLSSRELTDALRALAKDDPDGVRCRDFNVVGQLNDETRRAATGIDACIEAMLDVWNVTDRAGRDDFIVDPFGIRHGFASIPADYFVGFIAARTGLPRSAAHRFWLAFINVLIRQPTLLPNIRGRWIAPKPRLVGIPSRRIR